MIINFQLWFLWFLVLPDGRSQICWIVLQDNKLDQLALLIPLVKRLIAASVLDLCQHRSTSMYSGFIKNNSSYGTYVV